MYGKSGSQCLRYKILRLFGCIYQVRPKWATLDVYLLNTRVIVARIIALTSIALVSIFAKPIIFYMLPLFQLITCILRKQD